MTSPRTTAAQAAFSLSCAPQLISELVDCFDQVQNLAFLARGLDLAFTSADFGEEDDKWAVASLLDEVRAKIETVWKRIDAANRADLASATDAAIAAHKGTSPEHRALAHRVVKYFTGKDESDTPETLLQQGFDGDAELLTMALEVIGK